MRYCFYWLTNEETNFGKRGLDWFSQNKDFFDFLYDYFPQYDTFFFEPALKLPKRYGFHAEFCPPFSLNGRKQERDLFELLRKVTQSYEAFDVNLKFSSNRHCVFLEASHTMSSFSSITTLLQKEISDFVDDNIFEGYEAKFQMVLSHSTDYELTKVIEEISKSYWDKFKNIHCDSVSLCYQRTPHESFKELARLPLKSVY